MDRGTRTVRTEMQTRCADWFHQADWFCKIESGNGTLDWRLLVTIRPVQRAKECALPRMTDESHAKPDGPELAIRSKECRWMGGAVVKDTENAVF